MNAPNSCSPWSSLELTDDRAYVLLDRATITSEYRRLFRFALRRNRMGFLLATRGTAYNDNLDQFHRETNHLLSSILLRSKSGQGVLPQEVLFGCVQSLESIGFFIHLLNIARVACGRPFHPQPLSAASHYRVVKQTRVSFLKSAIINDIGHAMHAAGTHWLAERWMLIYNKIGMHVRNSIAHATYTSPETSPSGQWVFSEPGLDDNQLFGALCLGMTHSEFSAYSKNVLLLRLCCFDAIRDIGARIDRRSCTVQARHQLVPTESVTFSLTPQSLTVTGKKPFW